MLSCDHGVRQPASSVPLLPHTRAGVPNLPNMGLVACGADHTIGVSSDGYDVFTWGCGEKGQLGRGAAPTCPTCPVWHTCPNLPNMEHVPQPA
eukprot:3434050-Prymnesium_polylepis.1